MAFGLYKMLGFRFVPRFRDLEDQRFWRADIPDGEESATGYGPLEDIARNKVPLKRIATHWPVNESAGELAATETLLALRA